MSGVFCVEHHSGAAISWWRHQMETFFPLLALCAGNSPVTSELPSQRPMTRSFDFFFWSVPRTNGWVNTREAGDLRRHRGHYDVIVMMIALYALLAICVTFHRSPTFRRSPEVSPYKHWCFGGGGGGGCPFVVVGFFLFCFDLFYFILFIYLFIYLFIVWGGWVLLVCVIRYCKAVTGQVKSGRHIQIHVRVRELSVLIRLSLKFSPRGPTNNMQHWGR